jgi:hypothetical protein
MYTLTPDNDILKVKVLGPGRNAHNRVRVFTISSPEDEGKSMWGQINYELHMSNLFINREAAEKAAFIGKLS